MGMTVQMNPGGKSDFSIIIVIVIQKGNVDPVANGSFIHTTGIFMNSVDYANVSMHNHA